MIGYKINNDEQIYFIENTIPFMGIGEFFNNDYKFCDQALIKYFNIFDDKYCGRENTEIEILDYVYRNYNE